MGEREQQTTDDLVENSELEEMNFAVSQSEDRRAHIKVLCSAVRAPVSREADSRDGFGFWQLPIRLQLFVPSLSGLRRTRPITRN
ncbi:unnamed protein product [Pleuronectes platessa]|uniref:Uncharacterized protein n=1 Tax=Pleuronectes platessa TaxID=8262 RepID=A0A9N7ZBD1_PLEPL|nr:unnamed protein product [Pleuronectes platessa]